MYHLQSCRPKIPRSQCFSKFEKIEVAKALQVSVNDSDHEVEDISSVLTNSKTMNDNTKELLLPHVMMFFVGYQRSSPLCHI